MTIAVPIADAARLTQVSQRTMRRWLRDGKVRGWVQSERRQYVDLESAIAYRSRVSLLQTTPVR